MKWILTHIEICKSTILSLVGATEGNSNIVNIENHIGAVGFTGVWLPEFLHNLLLPLFVIRVDKETGEPIRDKWEDRLSSDALLALNISQTVSENFSENGSINHLLNVIFRNGFCIRCAPGEDGEFIGKIVRGDPIKDFQVWFAWTYKLALSKF